MPYCIVGFLRVLLPSGTVRIFRTRKRLLPKGSSRGRRKPVLWFYRAVQVMMKSEWPMRIWSLGRSATVSLMLRPFTLVPF